MSEVIQPIAPADSTAGERSTLSLRELARLVLRTWPHMRLQLPHVVVWIVARFALELLSLFSALVGFDLFNNKILLGEKLQPAQAVLLRLDEGYVRDPIAEADAGEDSKVESPGWFESFDESDVEESEVEVEATRDPTEFMTPEQRRVIRNRLGALFAIATVLIFMLMPTIDYYRTWILQRVNQYRGTCAVGFFGEPRRIAAGCPAIRGSARRAGARQMVKLVVMGSSRCLNANRSSFDGLG